MSCIYNFQAFWDRAPFLDRAPSLAPVLFIFQIGLACPDGSLSSRHLLDSAPSSCCSGMVWRCRLSKVPLVQRIWHRLQCIEWVIVTFIDIIRRSISDRNNLEASALNFRKSDAARIRQFWLALPGEILIDAAQTHWRMAKIKHIQQRHTYSVF